jgi:restriction endonuclease S subunit
MAKLFREGLRGERLKQTEIGEIPESWEVVSIGERCEKPRYGYTASASLEPVGPKFLRITDITEYGVDWTSVPYCSCPLAVLEELRLKSGDLVFARIGATTGKSYLITHSPEAVFASYLIRLRAKPGLDPAYLSCFFESEAYWSQIQANKGSNLKGGMSASILSRLLFPRPSLDEQEQIAATLKGVEQQIVSVLKKQDALKSLFSSMLHLLMTGQVRVTQKMIALHALEDRKKKQKKYSGKVDEETLQEVVRRIVEAAQPEKIILFGSAARGEMGPDSDVDLLVIKACTNKRKTWEIIEKKLGGIGVPKDIVVATPEDVEYCKDIPGYIIRYALREGKVVYPP